MKASTHLKDVTDLLVNHAGQLYDAEHRLIHLLYLVGRHVQTGGIADAVETYRRETETGLNRLRKVFLELGLEPRRLSCGTVKEAVSNCEDLLEAQGNQYVKEIALLAAIQGIQNYEIAFYRTSYCLAKNLSMPRAATLLKTSLEAETNGDIRISALIRRMGRSAV